MTNEKPNETLNMNRGPFPLYHFDDANIHCREVTEPRVGEVWKFEMTSPTGRAVWWTRTIKNVYGADGERWCDWEEKRSHLRDCAPVRIVTAGRLISKEKEESGCETAN